MKILDDSAWLCMEKLKKHSFETNKFKDLPKREKNRKRKNIRLYRCLEGALHPALSYSLNMDLHPPILEVRLLSSDSCPVIGRSFGLCKFLGQVSTRTCVLNETEL